MPSNLQSTVKPADGIPLPCSTALLNASPAASRISATSLSEKPQALANPATLLRARATFPISLV